MNAQPDISLSTSGAPLPGPVREPGRSGPISILLPARSRLPAVLLFLADWRGVLVSGLAVLITWRIVKPGSPVPTLLFFSLLGLVVLAALIKQAVASRRARRIARQTESLDARGTSQGDAHPPLREVLQPGPALDAMLSKTPSEERLIELLAGTSFAGEAVCVSARADRLPKAFEPLAVPFEPMVLDAASARLLAPPEDSGRSGRLLGLDHSGLAKAVRQVLLVLRRTGVFEGIGFVVLISLVFGLLLSGPLNRHVWTRGGIIALWVLVFLRRERVAGHLYIIPGGLIDARRKHVYRRTSGLMVWCADSRMLYVIDAGASPTLSFTVTPAEALVALRAWLSPQAGPSDELIQSFLGPGDSHSAAA